MKSILLAVAQRQDVNWDDYVALNRAALWW